jgi:hypothetical protein
VQGVDVANARLVYKCTMPFGERTTAAAATELETALDPLATAAEFSEDALPAVNSPEAQAASSEDALPALDTPDYEVESNVTVPEVYTGNHHHRHHRHQAGSTTLEWLSPWTVSTTGNRCAPPPA